MRNDMILHMSFHMAHDMALHIINITIDRIIIRVITIYLKE